MAPSNVVELLQKPPTGPLPQLDLEQAQWSTEVDNMRKLITDKLYHQFTEAAGDFIATKVQNRLHAAAFHYNVFGPLLLPLLNGQRVVEMLQGFLLGRFPPGPEEAKEYVPLITHYEAALKSDEIAFLLLSIVKARLYILSGELTEADALLFEGALANYMSTKIAIPISLNASYYLARSEFFQKKGVSKAHYENLALYLAYVNPNDFSEEQRQKYGVDLVVAGLSANDMYDFGALLNQPLVLLLQNSNYNWLYELVVAGGEGSLPRFQACVDANRSAMEQFFPSDKFAGLRRKFVLAAFLDLAFCSTTRVLTPREIAEHCAVPENEVEHLVMKAISLNLVKGTIDGVTNEVHLEWLQPRVIDKNRIGMLHQRVVLWKEAVASVVAFLEKTTTDLNKSTGVLFS